MTFLACLLSFSSGAVIFGGVAYRLGRFDEAEAQIRKEQRAQKAYENRTVRF